MKSKNIYNIKIYEKLYLFALLAGILLLCSVSANMPPIKGSFIIVNVIDNSTLEPLDVTEFEENLVVDPPHDYLSLNFTIRKLDGKKIYFTMPPPSANAYIFAKKRGYFDSDPLVINASFYLDKMSDQETEYIVNHTFYLKPIGFIIDADSSNREATPEIPGSFILTKVTNNDTGEEFNESEFFASVIYESPYESKNMNYSLKADNLSKNIFITMPLLKSEVTIEAKKEGFVNINPLTINSTFYWNAVENNKDHFLNHTFYLKPIRDDTDLDVCFNESCEKKEGVIEKEEEDKEEEDSDWTYVIIGIVILGLILLLIFMKKREK